MVDSFHTSYDTVILHKEYALDKENLQYGNFELEIISSWFEFDFFPSLKQTRHFKLENGKNQVQKDRG